MQIMYGGEGRERSSRDFMCILEGEIKAKAIVASLKKATHKAI